MRTIDVGAALFFISIVLSGLFDTAGFTFSEAPVVHLLPAIGVYVGLALVGWGFGTRTRAVNELTADSD